MKITASVGLVALLVWGMFARAQTGNTGHFVYQMTDKETGLPITNGTVSVKVQTRTRFGGHYTPDSYFATTCAASDSNGVADVEFQVYDSDFRWTVETPSHYSRGTSGRDWLGCVIEESDYLNIDTNTVDGLSKLNELKSLYNSGDYLGFAAKFEPKSVSYTNNVVYRSGSFYPKHNPQPMYSYASSSDLYLPMKKATVSVTNGVEVKHYRSVDLDMKECLLLPYSENYDINYDGEAGKVSDFHVERFSVTTNGVDSFYGWIDFAPGCGAYIRKTTGDKSFPMTYEVDTSETFLPRIPFEQHSVSGRVVQAKGLLADDEYMVLRTRVMTNSVGVVTNCNYSKILGPMTAQKKIDFTVMIFNPRPNDTNLEFDQNNNLAEDNESNRYP